MTVQKNLLVFLTDEQTWNTLSIYGNKALSTVHADELAKSGVAFNHCYTAYPLCCPARASLWTGLWAHNHHVTGNWRHIREELRDDGLIHPFRDAGYHTIYCGKWHVPGTTPQRFGVNDYSAIPAIVEGRDRGRFIPEYREFAERQGYHLHPTHLENLTEADIALLKQPGKAPCGTSEIKQEDYLEIWQTNRFIEALERRPQNQPFMAVVSYNAPHFPLIVPSPYDKIVDPSSVELPPNFESNLDGKPTELRNLHYYKQMEGLSEGEWRRFIAHYLGFCAMIDVQLGRIVTYLRNHNLFEDTIIVFTSDHGDMMGAHQLVEKGEFLHYDEALRVPLIIANAGTPTAACGEQNEEIVMLHDLLPTLANCLGVQMKIPKDAVSFAHLLTNPDMKSKRSYAMSETFCLSGSMNGQGDYMPPSRFNQSDSNLHISLRSKQYRYTFHYHGKEELYDKQVDPYEMHNVADQASYYTALNEMRELLLSELRNSDSVIPPLIESILS